MKQSFNAGVYFKYRAYGFSLLFWLVVISALLSFSQRVFAASDYAVFTLKPSFTELTRSKVRMLYRGKTKSLQGKRVELSDWPESSLERSEFYQYLLGKDVAQMNAYWASLSFSGKARPPKEIGDASVDALIHWLQEKPNRIGYAPLDALPQEAKILYVVSKEK
ncbi:hypothetical protein BCU70_03690 [Vibrio sp. 10N.286.49.C2]|uniref:hypothetical protein n=1 Tax=unclassified Vibrio TaxID=2614977 RepID=UPI000CAB3D2C|nr:MULTISPECIES: hypothetical protein [unclassified Vibrio]PMH36703.1 hypothetical protein BCU70_03690 [Vibrio sp. 10N.286.49.C2]PMH54691.1 hypothetical protein BCU66_10305 [Vibrio sp. 10N.286.49.B1]PMH78314.1 hypothetical protein BCU58_09580 [Vibrio sp. 10N.286.48.B7]